MKDFEEIAMMQSDDTKKQELKKNTPIGVYFAWAAIALIVIIFIVSISGKPKGQGLNDPQQISQTQEPAQQSEPLEPITYHGQGDDVIEVNVEKGYSFHITGNSANSHFAVKSYDERGNYLDLLVNTTDYYDGITIDMSFTTTMLEINAVGDWTVELFPIDLCPYVSRGNTITGNGDSVILIPDCGKTAGIVGNTATAHFSVKNFDEHGNYLDLLVNTTDYYDGKVLLSPKTRVMVINSASDWAITIN